MLSKAAAARKVLPFLLLLFCVVIGAQAASIASEQIHHHSSQHCCGLCHTGPLPFIQASVSGAAGPAVSIGWLESAAALDVLRETPQTAGGSRAPPV